MLPVHTQRETVKMRSDTPFPSHDPNIKLSDPHVLVPTYSSKLITPSSCPGRVRVAGHLIFCQGGSFNGNCVVEFRSSFDLTALGSQSR
jgi:hypothetical protein